MSQFCVVLQEILLTDFIILSLFFQILPLFKLNCIFMSAMLLSHFWKRKISSLVLEQSASTPGVIVLNKRA